VTGPDQNEQGDERRSCPRCGTTIVEVFPRLPGRPKRWCSAKCRRAASEERRAAAAGAIAIEYRPIDAPLEDHVKAVLTSPAACRRIVRDLRERHDAGELDDARWSPVAAELERTRPQARLALRWGAH
jgi:hypothetical protein